MYSMKKLIALLFICGGFAYGQTKAPAKKAGKANSEKTETVVLEDSKAEYVGGNAAMEKFIIDNLKYPTKLEQDTAIHSRKVVIKFLVDKTGKVGSVEIVKSIKGCKECSEEAIRVVSMMPNWKPAVENHATVDTWFTLPITFTKKK